MYLTPWNPWQELERVQAEIDALLQAALSKLRNVVPGRDIAFVPVTDIVETGDEYRLYLSLPGMLEEDIDIALQGTILIVRGEREPPFDLKLVALHQRQWRYGYFERRVQLPRAFDGEAIQASYDAGVLTIRIRKGEETAASGPGSGSAAGSASEDALPQADARGEGETST
jgi:HSP20 family protein